MFFSWSRNRSFGKGPKKRELTDFNYSEWSKMCLNVFDLKPIYWWAIFPVGCRGLDLEDTTNESSICHFSDFSGSNGRRESQGSLSSGASLELGTSGLGKNEVSLGRTTSHSFICFRSSSNSSTLSFFPAPRVALFLLQGDVSRGAVSVSTECSAPLRQCNISLPDGSCCSVPLRAGVSIRDLLLGLCEKLCINLAAIDLFLVGGEKV